MPETPPLHGAVRTRISVIAADGTPLSVLVATPPPGQPRGGSAVAGSAAAGAGAAGAGRAGGARADLPPVLAVHGFASNAADGWGRTGHLDALARAGRTVIAPDLRGHGWSGKPHDDAHYRLETVLDDLRRALLAAARSATAGSAEADAAMTAGLAPAASDDGVAAVDILGYSLGARLSWTIACRNLLPVRQMVLGGFDGRPLFEGADGARLDALAARVPGNDRVALRHLVRGLAGSGSAAGEMPDPPVPTLIVAGSADDLADRASAFAAGLPAGEFLSVPGRDHISAVPAQSFRRAVVAFLGR